MKPRKKSIYLVYEFLSEQGGLEREIISHANMLIEEGYEVKVLTCHLDKKILKQLPFEGIKIETISRINSSFEILNLASCALGFNNLGKYNPDAFIVYSFPANFLVRKKKSKKINYLNHFLHAYHMPLKDRIEWASGTQGIKRWISLLGSIFIGGWINKLDKKLVLSDNLIFMNSKYTKKRLDNLYGLKRSVISYPPLDKRFNGQTKKLLNEKFIFSSSRIIPDKKYEWLIEAISHMKNKIPLYLAGSVEEGYKNKLNSVASKFEVKIKFLGRLNTEELKVYYPSAQVFAFPTPGEDFGLVPAESLSCGTPVVIWGDGSGPTEQVIDGVNGFHAKPYDFKDFAKKIELLISTKFKDKNKARIIQSAKKFSYNKIKIDFIKEINKIMTN